jgi:hypothetical protein
MKYKIGDKLTFIFFGSPAKVNITEERDGKFFCQNDGAFGGSWHTVSEINERVSRHEDYVNAQLQASALYWQNGGPNGPTGHGDICMSDADEGL